MNFPVCEVPAKPYTYLSVAASSIGLVGYPLSNIPVDPRIRYLLNWVLVELPYQSGPVFTPLLIPPVSGL
jgi:hypothetical protein